MIRIKTLSLPLISALFSSAALPLNAQVALALSSQKSYRQDKKGIDFKGGSFKIRLNDGVVTSIYGCNDPNYFPPGQYIGVCSPGTTGFLASGVIDGATIQRPYLVVTSLQNAIVIEPGNAKRIKLTAAPASGLPRPAGGFRDESASVYYDLTTTSINQYDITAYSLSRNYKENQRSKFEDEIVTGVYQYSFPRLGAPNLPAVIKAVIYPMPEGLAKKNKQLSGFSFTNVNGNKWTNDGFVELSYLRPNEIEWKGLTASSVFAAVDKLYFSLKALRDPKDPKNSDVVRSVAVFPAFTYPSEDAETRILLKNPYVTSFTTPPIIPSGTPALVQLELERNFQTGGVTYDFSTRKFQIPVKVINRYSEYASIYLEGSKKAILADSDGDGYNNLNEWILGSSGSDEADIPEAPVPAPFQAVDIVGQPTPVGSYFGFNVMVQRATVPRVGYTLQRSIDQGKTWQTFKTDENWTVERVTNVERGITTTEIQVRSTVLVDPITETTPNYYIQPPGTLSHRYRVKITLKK